MEPPGCEALGLAGQIRRRRSRSVSVAVAEVLRVAVVLVMRVMVVPLEVVRKKKTPRP